MLAWRLLVRSGLAEIDETMHALAELTGTREQSLDVLGIKQGPQSLALTQVNQKIEIVRAKDWRAAPTLEAGEVVDVETLPAEIWTSKFSRNSRIFGSLMLPQYFSDRASARKSAPKSPTS